MGTLPYALFCESWNPKQLSHLKLMNPYVYVQSTEISSDPMSDINTTQNISTRISKNFHELRAKMSKYTPWSVQFLEGRNDFSLPMHLQTKYQIVTSTLCMVLDCLLLLFLMFELNSPFVVIIL